MSDNMRELTFEEYAVLYQKEAQEIFAKETPGCDCPPINGTLRLGMRTIGKAMEEIKWLSGSCKNCTDQWISVEERLPEVGERFIGCGAKGGVFLGRQVLLTSAFAKVDGASSHRNYTHWMSLPEPPKEEV